MADPATDYLARMYQTDLAADFRPCAASAERSASLLTETLRPFTLPRERDGLYERCHSLVCAAYARAGVR